MPSEQPPTRVHECPTCGSPVEVVSSDEGTHHYRPAPSEQPREGENARVDGDRWVNAVVEFVFPLDDVPVTATPEEKSAAAYAAVDETASILIDRHGAVVTTTYEDAPSDEPAQPQPRGEGDDLAKLRQELLLRAADLNADYVRSGAESAARDCRLMQRTAFLLRASTHPEQSERVVGAALDLLDSLGAPHYHDLIGMTYTLRKEQADNLRAALAAPTPTEQEDD